MKDKIRVLIADDHTIVRIGLAALLGAEKDIEVVGEAKNGDMAVKEALRLRPDVVIMDLMMPKKDGAAATAELREKLPSAKVVILTTFGASDGISHALKDGAAGALMKTADDGVIVSTIRAVAAGGTVVSPDVERLMAEDPPVPRLTPRQAEVLQSMTHGLTNRHRDAARHPPGQGGRTRRRHTYEDRRGKPDRSRGHRAPQAPSQGLRDTTAGRQQMKPPGRPRHTSRQNNTALRTVTDTPSGALTETSGTLSLPRLMRTSTLPPSG